MTKNCYIHIPFCKKKCNYCAFISYPCLDKITGYMFSLFKEISEKYSGEELATLYIGGGTPSLMPIDLLSKLLKKFKLAEGAEVTIEVNPDDVTADLIKKYLDLGINRISMGVQSLNDEVLKIAGRRHDADCALRAMDTINECGIENLSVDFIYGLPRQTINDFARDLKTVVERGIPHVSLYGLKIEDGTPFCLSLPQNLPNDDMQADMYSLACDFLSENKFLHYEISNFAKRGFESQHNLNYWANNSYYGFGVSAHGYVDGFRYYNTSELDSYISSPAVSEYAHFVTEKEALEEEIFLGLRRAEGINISDVNKKFNIDFYSEYKGVIKKYEGEFLVYDGINLFFTRRGFLLSNIILAEFI